MKKSKLKINNMEDKIFDKTITEIKQIKNKAEQEIYKILLQLEKDVNLKVESIDKKTTCGGRLDPWCSMEIKLKLPF